MRNRWNLRWVGWCGLWVVVSLASVSARDPGSALDLGGDARIRGFRVPNYNDEGVMTSQVFGEYAQVLPDGQVEVTDLRIEFYAYHGEERRTEMTVTSPRCLLNRTTGRAVSESDVRISRDDIVVTGKGFSFDNANQELKIMSESKVVLRGSPRKIAGMGEEKNRE